MKNSQMKNSQRFRKHAPLVRKHAPLGMSALVGATLAALLAAQAIAAAPKAPPPLNLSLRPRPSSRPPRPAARRR